MNRITLESDVMVSDPCYSDETWCQVKLKDVLPGGYITTVRKTEDPNWGNRCSVLLTVHEDYVEDTLSWRNYPGQVGVDSGQAGIFSMSSFKNDDIASSITTPDKTYDGRPFTLGLKDRDGDGGYRCLVAKHKGKIVGIAIDFGMERFPNKFLNELI